MTKKERKKAIEVLDDMKVKIDIPKAAKTQNDRNWALDVAIQALSQQPCDDAVSREAVIEWFENATYEDICEAVGTNLDFLPSVTQKSGKCKDCKYFEYDSVAKVDGIPLIVAHEICNKWGDGCKTSEDGYCYLYEPQESEDKECSK